MKKTVMTLGLAMVLTVSMSSGALALDYEIKAPKTTEYYRDTDYEDTYGAQYNYGGTNVAGMTLAEAADVMLELSGGAPLDFYAREPPPILLRFTTAGKKISLFAVTVAATPLTSAIFGPTERVILLHSGDDRTKRPPIANKHFFAVLQADGTHRFFSSDDPSQKTGGTSP